MQQMKLMAKERTELKKRIYELMSLGQKMLLRNVGAQVDVEEVTPQGTVVHVKQQRTFEVVRQFRPKKPQFNRDFLRDCLNRYAALAHIALNAEHCAMYIWEQKNRPLDQQFTETVVMKEANPTPADQVVDFQNMQV